MVRRYVHTVPKNESGNPAKRAAARREQSERPHRHAEAFCLMRYQADDRRSEEILFNSRDGVTPFTLTMRDGSYGQHVDWRNDQYAPDHQPQVGDRIFVDLTEDRAHELAGRQALRIWNGPVDADLSYNPKTAYRTIEQLQAHLLEGLLVEVDRGGPDVVEVTEEMARARGWLAGD